MTKKYLALLAVVVSLLIGIYPAYSAEESPNNVIEARKKAIVSTAKDIERLNAALLNYWQEKREWPVALSQLKSAGFISELPVSAKGEPYVGQIVNSGRQYRISFNMIDYGTASTISGILPNGVVSGGVVTTTIDTPNSSNVYQDVLGRSLDPDFVDRVVMKTDVDMASNDLKNVGGVNGDSINSKTTTSDTINAKTVSVGRAVIGTSSIQSSGTSITVSTTQAQHSTNATVGRNVTVGGNLQAGSARTGDLSAKANIVSNGGNLTGFTSATGSSANIEQVSANTIQTQTLNTQIGTSNNVTAVAVNGSKASIQSLSSTTASAQSGSAQTGNVNNASGGAITAETYTGNQTNINNLSAQNSSVGTATAGRLTVSGALSGNNGTSNTSNSTNLTATTVNSQNYTSNNTVSKTANINGNAVLTGRLVANTQLTATDVNADAAEIGSLSVTRNASVAGTTSARDLNVSQTLQTDSVIANSGTFNTLNGSTLSSNAVTAGEFKGGTFTGTDFITPVSSVMNNRNLITDQQNKLDNCMYVTTYCFPKAPVISNATCPSCTQSGYLLSFSATASANVSSCQHGCTYEWLVSGTASSSCPSGTIPKMNSGSVSLSCTITKTQGEGTSATGLISLVVKHARRTAYQASHNFNYAFTSMTAPTPSSLLVCNGCSQSTQAESSVDFSSQLTASYSNCPYGCTFTWGGACSSANGNTCFYSRTVNPGGSYNGTASITVVSNANPAKKATSSRSISYSVSYPSCPSNQIRVGGSCQCPTGSDWNGSTCETPPVNPDPPTPPSCTGGQVLVGGSCQCPANTTWNGASCEPDGTPPPPPPPPQCSGGQVLVGGVCQCPSGTTWDGYTCNPVGNPVATPSISASCSNCSATETSATSKNYTLNISALYGNCDPGCSISWGSAPTGFSKSSCSNQSVTGSGTVSCTLTTTVNPGTTRSGSISVSATNSQDATKKSSSSQSMSFTVNAPVARNWGSGCYVDTKLRDPVQDGSCVPMSTRTDNQKAAVMFSVGDMMELEYYSLSNSDGISIVWSGGSCSGGTNSARCLVQKATCCSGLGAISRTAKVYQDGILVYQNTIYAEDDSLTDSQAANRP